MVPIFRRRPRSQRSPVEIELCSVFVGRRAPCGHHYVFLTLGFHLAPWSRCTLEYHVYPGVPPSLTIIFTPPSWLLSVRK